VRRFLDRFDEVYSNTGKAGTIVGAPAAHHRLLWIHPFIDGNGRVARLVSHATLLEALDTGGVWSIARGLARHVADYKSHLTACDLERRNDLDGRGHLSEEALAAFTRFFLETCLHQVTFMEGLVEPGRLRARISLWVEEEVRMGALPARAGSILEAVLYRGELPRGEVADVLGVSDRQARRVVAALTERRVLTSESPRSPLHIAFPAEVAGRWMPGLFPERTA
jgi:Fic family protein